MSTINFDWVAKDGQGRRQQGVRAAPDVLHVRVWLRDSGLTPVRIRPAKVHRLGKIPEKEMVIFTRQLATLINAGIPVVQAMQLLRESTQHASMQALIDRLGEAVSQGEALSRAMAGYPQYFDGLYRSLVSAGEQGGVLDSLLLKLAHYREKRLALRNRVKSALVYPAAVLLVAFAITALLLIFVIPKFGAMFEGFGADLPLMTQWVMHLSHAFVRFWYLVVGMPVLAVMSFLMAYRRWPAATHAIDRGSLRLPVLGEILHKAALARFTRTLGTLHAAGVPLTDSLQTSRTSAGNWVISESLRVAGEAVQNGARLATGLAQGGHMPPMVLQMVSIGEESGALEQMLGKLADFFDNEVDEGVRRLTSLLEPALMVVIGGLVGSLIVAMYLPIFKIAQVVTH